MLHPIWTSNMNMPGIIMTWVFQLQFSLGILRVFLLWTCPDRLWTCLGQTLIETGLNNLFLADIGYLQLQDHHFLEFRNRRLQIVITMTFWITWKLFLRTASFNQEGLHPWLKQVLINMGTVLTWLGKLRSNKQVVKLTSPISCQLPLNVQTKNKKIYTTRKLFLRLLF